MAKIMRVPSEPGPEPWDRIVALAKVSLASPIAMSVLRLHHEEYGSCAECGMDSNKGWPCPTVLAIEEAARQPTALQMLQDMARRELGTFAPPTQPEEATDGTA